MEDYLGDYYREYLGVSTSSFGDNGKEHGSDYSRAYLGVIVGEKGDISYRGCI